MDDRLILIITFFSVGILYIIMGIPLYLEKVKPNWMYGFRVQKTVKNKDIWYKVNKQAGRDIIISGGIIIVVLPILLTFETFLTLNGIIIITIFLLIIPLIIILYRGFSLLSKL